MRLDGSCNCGSQQATPNAAYPRADHLPLGWLIGIDKDPGLFPGWEAILPSCRNRSPDFNPLLYGSNGGLHRTTLIPLGAGVRPIPFPALILRKSRPLSTPRSCLGLWAAFSQGLWLIPIRSKAITRWYKEPRECRQATPCASGSRAQQAAALKLDVRHVGRQLTAGCPWACYQFMSLLIKSKQNQRHFSPRKPGCPAFACRQPGAFHSLK